MSSWPLARNLDCESQSAKKIGLEISSARDDVSPALIEGQHRKPSGTSLGD